jgi:hypothetical protein
MSILRKSERFDPNINVKLLVYELMYGHMPRLVDQRLSHNVMTNTGRNWVVQRLGGSDYSVDPPVSHTSAVAKYIGLGCGGALQTKAGFAATQVELASVLALEDPVPVSKAGDVRTYLKQCNAQVSNTVYFPGTGRTVFVGTFLETEVSFAANATALGQVVGTEVPVSEAGLYLSTAVPTYDPVAIAGMNPQSPNQLIAYNCFSPVISTPNTLIRVEWELRV